MKHYILASTLLCSTLVQAGFIGGEVSLGYLSDTPSGSLQYKGTSADVEETFGWKKEDNLIVKAYIELPAPLIPNIRAVYTKLSHEGTGNVVNFIYDNKIYNGTVSSAFDTDIIDATLYYEILDNWINIDVGVNAKYINGTSSLTNAFTGTGEADISIVIPTLYAKARVNIPMSNLSFQAEGDLISYDGNTLYDLYLSARYTLSFGLGIEAGVKMMKFELEDVDDLTADIDFSAAYAAVVWDF